MTSFGSVGHNLMRYRPVEVVDAVLSAASRKSFVGRISLQRESTTGERLAGSLAVTVAHYLAGARIFRVHDVKPQVEALRAISALAIPNMAQTG